MAAAVVELADPARAASGAPRARGRSRGRACRPSTCARALPVFSASSSNETASARNSPSESQRRWFSLDELLHVLGRRAAGAGLEQAAAVHQRHDRQHLRAGAELEDREQVGQVVAQHVAGDRDRVLAGAGALEREAGRLGDAAGSRSAGRRCRAARAPGGPSCSSSASWARVSSSQNTAGAPVARARADGEPDPVLDRRVLGLAGAPDVARLRPRARSASSPSRVDDADACRRASISKVLSCEPYSSAACAISPTFGRRAHRRRVERAVAPAVVDRLGVERRVGVVGDHELGVLLLAVRRSTSGPEARIAAGIEASMITSLGTCRLVMPRSESTIASAGPVRRVAGSRCPARQRAEAVVGVPAARRARAARGRRPRRRGRR